MTFTPYSPTNLLVFSALQERPEGHLWDQSEELINWTDR